MPCFVGQLVDAVASTPAFVFVSRGFDESPLVQARKRGIARPYIDGSGSARTVSSRSVELGIFDPYILRCASRVASYQHSEELLGNVHLHADIWQHV